MTPEGLLRHVAYLGEREDKGGQAGTGCDPAETNLTCCLKHDQGIAEIADFLFRTPSEIRAWMQELELGLSRKLARGESYR